MVLLAGVLLLGSACNDVVTYNDGYDDGTTPHGAPAIEYVASVDAPDSPITDGVLAQMVMLRGKNLSQVRSISFNDIEVDLEEAYAVNSAITVPVPRTLPKEVNNTITVITSRGTVTTPFTINIPDLKITGFYNDFVQPGDTTMLKGENFDIYGITPEEGSITVDGTPLIILSAPDTYSLEVKVPTAVTGNNLTAEITGSQQETPVRIKLRQCDLMLTDFTAVNDNTVWPWGHPNITDGTNTGDPENAVVGGAFARFQGTLNAWSDARIFDCKTAVIPKEILDDMENYDLVFEVLTKPTTPLKPGFRFEGAGNPAGTGISGSDYWYPAGTTSAPLAAVNTYDEWMTCRVPATYRFGVGGDAGRRDLGMVMFDRTSSNMELDFSLANFRLVKRP